MSQTEERVRLCLGAQGRVCPGQTLLQRKHKGGCVVVFPLTRSTLEQAQEQTVQSTVPSFPVGDEHISAAEAVLEMSCPTRSSAWGWCCLGFPGKSLTNRFPCWKMALN